MKKLLLVFLFISVKSLDAQNYNFKIVDERLMWQAVYNKEVSPDEMVSYLKQYDYITDIQQSQDDIIARIDRHVLDHRGAGSSDFGVSPFVKRNVWSASFRVEFKPGRYRVTIVEIISDLPATSLAGSTQTKDPLEKWALKSRNSEFRIAFKKYNAVIFNHSFNKIFDFTYQKFDDDW